MSTKTHATIEDLYKVEGKAELVNGEIVEMPPAGEDPGAAGFEIAVRLREYTQRTGRGRAFPDGVGFEVNLPHRKAFSPDAAYHVGPRRGMRFAQGAPIFAVEVRSEHDYGPAAERAMREKRTDYFACGTLVVWDVALQSEDVIKSYRASDPDNPVIFRRGEVAEYRKFKQPFPLAAPTLYHPPVSKERAARERPELPTPLTCRQHAAG